MAFHTPTPKREYKIDTSVETVIPVIASFNINGGIKPLYFKYNEQTITIHGVHYCKQIYGCYVYDCAATLDGYVRTVTITYRPDKQLWTLKV